MRKRAKSRLEIAFEYGISSKTLARWLKKDNIQLTRRLVSIKEQELIYETYGHPEKKHEISNIDPPLESQENLG